MGAQHRKTPESASEAPAEPAQHATKPSRRWCQSGSYVKEKKLGGGRRRGLQRRPQERKREPRFHPLPWTDVLRGQGCEWQVTSTGSTQRWPDENLLSLRPAPQKVATTGSLSPTPLLYLGCGQGPHGKEQRPRSPGQAWFLSSLG